MRVAVVSANLGNFEQSRTMLPQSVEADFHIITDKEFPPRSKSMTPRLQARIVKTHMWDFAPGYDIYVWVDSSHDFARTDGLEWLLDNLRENGILTFAHPDRKTIWQEADYLKKRLSLNCPYITPRYENELIDEQLQQVDHEAPLLASTIFAYHFSPRIQHAMTTWWYHISRYHSIDQLSFPHILEGLKTVTLPRKEPYFKYVRNKPKEVK